MADTLGSSPAQVYTPVTTRGLQLGGAFRDIGRGLAMWRIWLALSWQEFRSTYRRSLIGFLWVTLSFAAFIFVKLTIFSSLLQTDDAMYYNAFLVVGFYVWMFLQPSISSAPDTFVSAQGWIRSEPLPYSLYVFKAVMREMYNFALTFIVVLLAFWKIGFAVTPAAVWALPAVAFLIVNACSYKLLIGLISARFRDLSHLVKAVMMPMMFLTPIFWMPSQMPGLMKYLWWNPLYHFMELFRAPFLGEPVPVESWIFAGTVYGGVTLVALVLFARFRQRIVFWF